MHICKDGAVSLRQNASERSIIQPKCASRRTARKCERIAVKGFDDEENLIVAFTFRNISKRASATEHEIDGLGDKGFARVGRAKYDVQTGAEFDNGRIARRAMEG